MGSAGLAPGLIRRTMEHGLLSLLAAVAIFAASVAPQSPCTPSPCGINTVCDVNGAGSAVCRCQAGFDHAPGSNTIEGCPNRISANTPRRPAQRPSRPRSQELRQALLTPVSPPPAAPMLTVGQLAIERCAPALLGMRAILTPAALPTRAPSTLAEQMPAAKGVVAQVLSASTQS